MPLPEYINGRRFAYMQIQSAILVEFISNPGDAYDLLFTTIIQRSVAHHGVFLTLNMELCQLVLCRIESRSGI